MKYGYFDKCLKEYKSPRMCGKNDSVITYKDNNLKRSITEEGLREGIDLINKDKEEVARSFVLECQDDKDWFEEAFEEIMTIEGWNLDKISRWRNSTSGQEKWTRSYNAEPFESQFRLYVETDSEDNEVTRVFWSAE